MQTLYQRILCRRNLWLHSAVNAPRLLSCSRVNSPRCGFFGNELRHSSVVLETRRLITSSSTDVNDDWKRRFVALVEKSAAVDAATAPEQVESIIYAWEDMLKGRSHDEVTTDHMEKLYGIWKDSARSKETSRPYRSMFHVLAKLSGKRALSILQEWEEVSGNIDLAIPETYVDDVIRSYATIDHPDLVEEGAAVASQLIVHLERSYSYNPKGLPNAASYRNVVRCLSKEIKRNPVDPSLIQVLMEHMDKFIQQIDPMQISVEQDTFNSLVLALHDALTAYSVFLDTGTEASGANVLAHSKEWRLMWSQLIDPDNRFNWMNVPNFVAVLEQTTMAILRIHHREMKNMDQETKDIGAVESCTQLILGIDAMLGSDIRVLPSGRHYLRTIQAWSLVRDRFGVVVEQQHTMLLARMREHHQHHHCRPETGEEHARATESWNNVLRAFLDAKRPQGVEELWDTNAEPSKELRRMRRNQESFTILFRALAAKRNPDSEKGARIRATKAHRILQKMLMIDKDKRIFQPSAEHFASVMLAWQRSFHKYAATNCQQLFDRLLEEAVRSDDMEPNQYHYNALLITWGYSADPEASKRILEIVAIMRNRQIELDAKTYSAVLFGLSRSRNKEGPKLANELMSQMERIATEQQSTTILSTQCYNHLMNAQAQSKDPRVAALCEDTYQRHWHAYSQSGFNDRLRPNSHTYATRIDAHTNCGQANADRAEALLEEMEALSAEGHAEAPGLFVYTAVLKACWKDDSVGPERVQTVLDRMEGAYAAGNDAAKPDAHAMTILLLSWAKSNSPNKAEAAWNILETMKTKYLQGDLSMKPTSYTYAAVLNACAFMSATDPSLKENTVRIAVTALQELSETEGGFTQHAFRNMLQVVIRQTGDANSKQRLATRVFQKCCQEGFVDPWIVTLLKTKVPSLYAKLPLNKDGVYIPEEWRRRVQHDTRVETR